MRQLTRTVRGEGSAAPSLPRMFPSLWVQQVSIRKGELSMIAGPPGVGKSTLALAMAVRANVPTVYFSADTHAHTMSLRLLSMLTGVDQHTAEHHMASSPEWASATLGATRRIRWCFDAQPSVDQIMDQIEAHIELTTYPPELVVIDNLTDLVSGSDEYAAMRDLLKDFKYLARKYDTAIVVLHHTQEGVAGNPCPPRFALQGKVSQTPAMVLTVCQDASGFLGVCPVKNRYGPSAPQGDKPVWLRYEPARMQVTDLDEEHGRTA